MFDPRHGIERFERLVQQQDLRPHSERASDAHALRHPTRQLSGEGLGEIGKAN